MSPFGIGFFAVLFSKTQHNFLEIHLLLSLLLNSINWCGRATVSLTLCLLKDTLVVPSLELL